MKKKIARSTFPLKATISTSLALLICVSLLVTGCSKSTDSADFYDEYFTENTSSAPSDAGNGFYHYKMDSDQAVESESYGTLTDTPAEDSQSIVNGRKIIYSSYYRVQTTVFDQALSVLNGLCEKYGAYYEHSECWGNAENGSRNGSYTIRVPVQNYKAFCTEAGTIGTVVHSTENNEDVTERYFDTEARLESAKIREERLLDILRSADSLDNVLLLEAELAEVRYEIENLSGTLRKYDSLVSYSTVEIDIAEVYRPITVQNKPRTFGERISNALASGFEDFTDSLQDFAVSLSYSLPSFITFILFVIVVVFLLRFAIRKAKKKLKMRKAQNSKEHQDKNN